MVLQSDPLNTSQAHVLSRQLNLQYVLCVYMHLCMYTFASKDSAVPQ